MSTRETMPHEVGFAIFPASLPRNILLSSLPLMLLSAVYFFMQQNSQLAGASLIPMALIAVLFLLKEENSTSTVSHLLMLSALIYFNLTLSYFDPTIVLTLASLSFPIFMVLLSDTFSKAFWGVVFSTMLVANYYLLGVSIEMSYQATLLSVMLVEFLILNYAKQTVVRDRLNLVRIQERVQFNRERLNHTLPLIELDHHGYITSVNSAFVNLCGVPSRHLTDMPLQEVKFLQNGFDYQTLQQALTQNYWEEETHGTHPNGRPFWLSVNMRRNFDQDLRHTGFTLICKDITHEKNKLQQMSHDSVTEVLNNHVFRLFVEQAAEMHKRYREDYTILTCQIDNLTQLNYQYGLSSGDETLAEVSEILKRVVRDTDVLCRWNGNTFAVLLSRANALQAKTVETKIINALSEHAFVGRERVFFKVGIAPVQRNMNASEWLQTMRLQNYQGELFSSSPSFIINA